MQGVLMAFRKGDVPVARAYLDSHADGRERLALDLLAVWAAESADEKLRNEGNALLFGLKGQRR